MATICCLFLVTPQTTYASTPKYQTGYISSDKPVKMYKKANVKSKVLRKLCHNKQVKFKRYNKKWYIVIRGKKKGFVRSKYVSTIPTAKKTTMRYSNSYFMQMGIIYWGDWRWTWYSQRVLPGGGLNIPGRHVNGYGYVCDQGGYICLASSVLSRGTVVNTPFGWQGKVYDSGCASNTLDVYVDW